MQERALDFLRENITRTRTRTRRTMTTTARTMRRRRMTRRRRRRTTRRRRTMTLSHHCTVAWVTRPERPKGVKDVFKQAPRLLVCKYYIFVPKIYK